MRAPTDKQGPLKVGDLFLSNWVIERVVGRGGHAWVYDARHRFIGRHVALKIIPRVDREAFRRAIAEAQIQYVIQHPGMVPVEDINVTDDGTLYMIMPLLQGRSFRAVLNEHGKLKPLEMLPLLLQVAEVMLVAHAAGVIHRDLKPENIFVCPGNEIKVIDFGVAKVLHGAGWTTQKDLILGTTYYMSPEQAQGYTLTPQTDIYSLGIIAYEALSGQHPVLRSLGRRPRTVPNLTDVIVLEPPDMLHVLDRAISGDVAALVNQMIAKLCHQRFAAMSDAVKALREVIEALELEAKRLGMELPRRDFSRPLTTSSVPGPGPGGSSGAPEVSERDTTPQVKPLFFGAVSSSALPDSQRSSEEIQDTRKGGELGARGTRTAPLGSPGRASADRFAEANPQSVGSGPANAGRARSAPAPSPAPGARDATPDRVWAVTSISSAAPKSAVSSLGADVTQPRAQSDSPASGFAARPRDAGAARDPVAALRDRAWSVIRITLVSAAIGLPVFGIVAWQAMGRPDRALRGATPVELRAVIAPQQAAASDVAVSPPSASVGISSGPAAFPGAEADSAAPPVAETSVQPAPLAVAAVSASQAPIMPAPVRMPAASAAAPARAVPRATGSASSKSKSQPSTAERIEVHVRRLLEEDRRREQKAQEQQREQPRRERWIEVQP